VKIPANIPTDQLPPLLLDTREPTDHPWNLHPFRVERQCLPFGDATLRGFERELIFERKTKTDLVGCVGRERERFEKCITGMLGHRLPFLVIEAGWVELENHSWPGTVTPSQVLGSLIGWQARGIHLIVAGDADRAGKLVAKIAYTVARRAWQQARELLAAVETQEAAT
jgi:DNA excision repair protein ERCC-4